MADHIVDANKKDAFDGEEFRELFAEHALCGRERNWTGVKDAADAIRTFCRRVRDEAVADALAFAAKSPPEPLPDQPGSVAPTGGTVGGGESGEMWPKWFACDTCVWECRGRHEIVCYTAFGKHRSTVKYQELLAAPHILPITPDEARRLLEGCNKGE